tara:strand:- start:56 stop:379 length:324 start_codon:yes stop_codon:yes gene_type:complete
MANIICEYKMDKERQGGKIRPLWLDEGGVWYDPDKYAYIGVVKDPEVKVPETVVRYTKESFVERQLDLHDRHPFTKDDPESNDPVDRIEMTEKEITDQSEEWWDNNV